MRLTYIGHSTFFLQSEGGNFLIDPYEAKDFTSDKKIDAIFLTHGHGDHLGDAIEISIAKNVPIVAIFELANYCAKKGARAIPVGTGGKINEFNATFLPAIHSSSTPDGTYAGNPASVLINGIFHAGDSALTREYKTIGEIYKPKIALLPIGGHFTMGVDEAVIAAKWLGAETIIPMHFNTFAQIQADKLDFKQKIEAQGQKCVILGVSATLEV